MSSQGHRLGPDVVGLRVVVRYRLPDGRATDVLGTCLAWSDDVCVVEPADGVPVEIAVADVVTGKPVPPRASVRQRVSPDMAQRHGFALFPDLETVDLGPWVLRRSAAATARRANSVLAFAPAPPEAVDAVTRHYLACNQRPIAAVLPGTAEEELFLAAGWLPESGDADTLFQVAGTAQVARALRGIEEVDLTDTGDGLALAHLGDVARGVAGLGAGLGAGSGGDWVGFRSIEVTPSARRRGLALRVMATLVGWGAERGATTCYLQVLGDNDPALALYERLGFTTHHTYRYLAEHAVPASGLLGA